MNEVPVLILFVTKTPNADISRVIQETRTKFKFFRNIHVLTTNDERLLEKYTVLTESEKQPSETEICKYLQPGAEIIPEVSSYAEETHRES
jgi:hypothetical protein